MTLKSASTFRESYLELTSSSSKDPAEIYSGNYDIIIASASWDSRSIVLTEAENLSASSALIFSYKKKDSNGKSAANFARLHAFFAKAAKSAGSQEVDAAAVQANFKTLENYLEHKFFSIKRPLNIFIDLSTTPRYLTLGAMGIGFRKGIVASVTYGYAEGDYGPSTDPKVMFTEGGWVAKAIPGFEGEWEPQRKSHYVVSVGFEGTKTRQFITRSEPDRVSILFPEPPVKDGYSEMARNANKRLFEDYRVPKPGMVSAHAASALDAVVNMDKSLDEDYTNENCLYLCCGTKPHSLALAIRSLLKAEPGLLYILPESHKETNISPNGVFWQYRIVDRSCPVTEVVNG